VVTSREIIFGLIAGAVLMLFGFFPPPLHRFMEEMRDLSNLLSSRFPTQPYSDARRHWARLRTQNGHDETPQRSWWLVGSGIALIAVTIFSLLSEI
jgi:hypothetical protein